MATYYVAPPPVGNDANPGTALLPWATVNHAATTAVAGDTVYYNNGTYDLGAQQTAWNSGSAIGGYIIHEAINSHLAIWEQTSYTSGAVELTAESYIQFVGIRMQQAVITSIGWFVDLNGCDHITLDDVEITQTCPHGLFIRDGCSDITVNGCEIHPEDVTAIGYGRDGVLIYGTAANTNIVITNCEIYHTSHVGINSASNCHVNDTYVIHDNIIHDNMSHCIGMEGRGTAEIYDNVLYGAGSYWTDAGTTGLLIGGNDTDDVNVTAYRNDIYDNGGPGIQIFSTCGTVNIWNNTLERNNEDGPDYGSIGVLFRAGTQGTIHIRNNIIYHTWAGRYCYLVDIGALAAISTDYNLWYDSTLEETMWIEGVTYGTFAAYVTAGYEPNSVMSQDPLFTNQAAHDFSLQAGSPAIDEGVNVGLPYQGVAPDIGAHERSAGGGAVVMLVIVVTVVTMVQT